MSSYSNSSYSAPVNDELPYTNSQIKAARLLVRMQQRVDEPVEARTLEIAAQPMHRRTLTPAEQVSEVEAMLKSFEDNPPPNGWHWEVGVLLDCLRSALDGEIDA